MARSIDTHKLGCACPVCSPPEGRLTAVLSIRLPADLAAWVRAHGGRELVQRLLEEERERRGEG